MPKLLMTVLGRKQISPTIYAYSLALKVNDDPDYIGTKTVQGVSKTCFDVGTDVSGRWRKHGDSFSLWVKG